MTLSHLLLLSNPLGFSVLPIVQGIVMSGIKG